NNRSRQISARSNWNTTATARTPASTATICIPDASPHGSSSARRGSRRVPSPGGTPGDRELGRTDPPDERKLERRRQDLQAEVEREKVDLDTLVPPHGKSGKSEKRDLHAGAARRLVRQRARQKILADRGRRQLEPQLGHGPSDPG